MLFVPIVKLRPGMVVAKPVCQARQRVYFVQKGFTLDARSIARLQELGVTNLWIECAGLNTVAERVNDTVENRRDELTAVLSTTVDRLRQRNDAKVECGQLEDCVGELLKEVLDDPAHEPILTAMAGDCDVLVRHLANTCYLATLLGTQLSGYVRHQRRRMPSRLADDLRQLGVGALLHDLGKIRLTEQVQQTHGLHPDAGDAAYRAHIRIGADMLRGRVSPLALYMVLHHHQRYDGTGFPRIKSRDSDGIPAGLAGDRIHVFARILAVADAFDHLLSDPETPRTTIQALHALQQPEYHGCFDPVVLAALSRLIPPFMIGTVVTLTDETEAVVVANHSEDPCAPTVRSVHGEIGMPDTRVDDEDVDLRYTPGLAVGFADGVDVRPYHFRLPKIDDDAMAYWDLRAKGLPSAHVDPALLVATE